MALLRDLWNFDQSLNPALFYKNFESLNSFFDISLATPEKLMEIQKTTLQAAYKQKESYAQLNSFITEMMGSKQGTEEDLFAQLVNGINKGLNQFRAKENKDLDWDRKGFYDKLDNIVAQIEQLANQTAGTQGISAPSIQPIKDAVAYARYADFIKEKGKYLEDLGAWIMQMAGLGGFSTGAWQASDKFFGEKAQASIIEDAMGLLLNGTQKLQNISNNFIWIKAQNYNNKTSIERKQQIDEELQEWINSIKELNGLKVLNGRVTIGTNISSPEQFANLISLVNNHASTAQANFSISLSDSLYEQIQKLSVNIQGKSNIERHLANEGNRSIYRINSKDKYYNQLLKFSRTEPVVKQTAVSLTEQQTKYKEFAAYVNYNLSHNLNNTVYGRNEFYLTKEGFTDLATLMEKRNFYIRIKNLMLSYQEFLNNSFQTTYI